MPQPNKHKGTTTDSASNFVRDQRAVWTAGLYLSSDCITAVLTAPGEGHEPDIGPLCWKIKNTRAENVVNSIAGISRLLHDGLPQSGELELAVAVSGHVDATGRIVTASSELRDNDQNWTDVELATLIERATGNRTHVVNDANALTAQDQMYGRGRGHADFATVFINDYGVGCGIVANGRLVMGSGGSAGELGHIRVNGSRQPCRCGGVGCLERVASMSAIRAAIDNLGEQAPDGSWVIDVLQTAGRSLGSALVALVNLLNPSIIVVHGPGDLLETSPDGTESVFIDAVKDAVCSRSAFSNAGLACRVVTQAFTPEYLATGAATFARDYRASWWDAPAG